MPLFEYRCEACDHLEELLQKHSDPAPTACPVCGKQGTMHKEISATSFQLKGGGWYKDLYSSTKKPESKSGDAKPESKAGDAKPESKAEAKPESKPAKPETKSSSSGSSSASAAA